MDDFIDDLGDASSGIEVELPTGRKFFVMTEGEREFVEQSAKTYQEHNRFQNVSDLSDLDRIIMNEMLAWRWSQWLSLEQDYDGDDMLDPKLSDNLVKINKEILALKKNIGVDKASRDKERGESIAQYVADIGRRAREFGVMRNEQAEKAITLWMDLIALVTLHDGCTEDERKQNGCTTEEVLAWVRRVQPEFEEIDKKFRETSQKYWIREQ